MVQTWETHLCDAPPQSITSNKTEMMEYYKKMYTYRRMEIAADVMYKAQQIRGFCHLYDGQVLIQPVFFILSCSLFLKNLLATGSNRRWNGGRPHIR